MVLVGVAVIGFMLVFGLLANMRRDCSRLTIKAKDIYTPWTAFVQPHRLTSRRMKLKNLIPLRYRTKIIRQFGQAKLVKLPNGQHQLIGGNDQDRIAAFEWASLFAHKIVFTDFHREAKPLVRRVTLRPPLWKCWPMRHAL